LRICNAKIKKFADWPRYSYVEQCLVSKHINTNRT
jgi:hypothetical protein